MEGNGINRAEATTTYPKSCIACSGDVLFFVLSLSVSLSIKREDARRDFIALFKVK